MPTQDTLIERLDAILEQLQELRAAVADGTELGPTNGQGDELTLRRLRFLRPFYDAPGRSLHVDDVSELAREVGYDPRGTAGFYVGEGASLVSVDEMRVLTRAG